MKLFRDASLKEEVKVLDLGIVQAGETKEFLYFVLNDSKAELRSLKFKVDHQEVVVKNAPDALESGQKGELRMVWAPQVTIKEGLKTKLLVEGDELWR